MNSITVDAEDLIIAWEIHGYEAKYIFDRQTGEVIFIPDVDIVGGDAVKNLLKQSRKNGARAILLSSPYLLPKLGM